MKLRYILLSCILTIAIGCNGEHDFTAEEDETFEEEEDESNIPPSLPPAAPEEKEENPSHDDEGFSVCPSDTYTLLVEDGVEYTIEIPVFCEPIVIYNLGCPEPGY